MSEQIKKLLVNTSQDLSEAEKLQGRQNLGIDGTIPEHVLTYDEQVLSNSEKLQVKTNLGFVTPSDLATVAFTNSYTDLSNKPSIPPAQVNSDWNATSGVAEILNKPNLATVATSGSYNDLINTPTIPAAQVNSDWNASSGLAQILNKPSLLYRGYGEQDASITSLKIDADDPEGYVAVNVNGGQRGSLIAGPYSTLLNSGINGGAGKGSKIVPVFINTSGQFDTCEPFPKSVRKINASQTVTSTDISNGYIMIDVFELPYPEDQIDVSFVASVADLHWVHGSQSNRLIDRDISSIEVWGSTDSHSTIGYMYRNINNTEFLTTDSNNSQNGGGFWNMSVAGSTNGGVMKYLTFKVNFASGTTIVAGDYFAWWGRLSQLS